VRVCVFVCLCVCVCVLCVCVYVYVYVYVYVHVLILDSEARPRIQIEIKLEFRVCAKIARVSTNTNFPKNRKFQAPLRVKLNNIKIFRMASEERARC
jgi:hypothetical protein